MYMLQGCPPSGVSAKHHHHNVPLYWQKLAISKVVMPCFGQDRLPQHLRTRLAMWSGKHWRPELLRVCLASGEVNTDLGHISLWAARYGSLACLRITREIGDKWNLYTTREAAAGGNPRYNFVLCITAHVLLFMTLVCQRLQTVT
jgi:hypothetical protein